MPCGTGLTADHASLWQGGVMTALPSTFEVERRSVTDVVTVICFLSRLLNPKPPFLL